MADEFVSVTRRGWGGRLGNSFVAIIFGAILGLGSFPVLFLNEGRAVKRHQTLEEGAEIVVSTDAGQIDPALEGKLVHATGRAEVSGELSDSTFGISAPAIRLNREVEMYQWLEKEKTETRNKAGGSTEKVKTTVYEKQWADSLQKSDRFEHPEGHQNPRTMRFESKTLVADTVTMGVFRLPKFFIQQIKGENPVVVESVDALAEPIRPDAKLNDGGLYFGADPASPEVGDIRVRFTSVMPGEISVVAKQTGDTFEKYRTVAGGELDILVMGAQSAEAMFEAEESANKMRTWILRGAGFLMMAFGLTLVAQPLRVMADVLPVAGRIVGAGIGFIAFAVAAIGSTVTIASAWIFYRPLIGISILMLTAVAVFFLFKRFRKTKPETPNLTMPAEVPPPLD